MAVELSVSAAHHETAENAEFAHYVSDSLIHSVIESLSSVVGVLAEQFGSAITGCLCRIVEEIGKVVGIV